MGRHTLIDERRHPSWPGRSARWRHHPEHSLRGGGTTRIQRRQLSQHRLMTGARLAPTRGRTVPEGAVGQSGPWASFGAVHGQGSLPSWTKVNARSSVGNRVRASTAANGAQSAESIRQSQRWGASAIAAGTQTARSPESHAANPKVAPTRPRCRGQRDTSIDQEDMRVLTPMPIPEQIAALDPCESGGPPEDRCPGIAEQMKVLVGQCSDQDL